MNGSGSFVNERTLGNCVVSIPAMPIKAAIEEFAQRLQKLIEGHAMERAKAAVLDAFGIHAPKKRGRPPKALPAIASGAPPKARKKMPPQFCPVPGCKNKAAPVFGMVCAEHKDVAKSKIKQYREERKAKKHGQKAGVKKAATKMATTRKAATRKATTKKAAAKATAKAAPKKAAAKKPGKKVHAKAVSRKAAPRPEKTAVVVKAAPVVPPPAPPAAA
jgi:hypothetical protein